MPDEETCTIESTSRSSEKEDNSDHIDAGGDDDDKSMNQNVDQVADGKNSSIFY